MRTLFCLSGKNRTFNGCIARAFCVLTLLLEMAACHSRVFAQTVASATDATQIAGNELDPSIAVNPYNPSNIFIVSYSETLGGLVTSSSENQGSTWATNTIADGSDSLPPANPSDAYPSVAWDASSNIYIAYFPSTYEGVAVIMSTNGGETFTAVTNLAENDATDTPRIAAGPPSAPGIWVVYKDYSKNQSPLIAQGLQTSVSNAVFGPPWTIPGSGSSGEPDIAVGPQGQVMVAFQDTLDGSAAAHIYTAVNTNAFGTNGFSAASLATSDAVGGLTYIAAQSTGIGISATPRLAFDNDPHSIYAGRVYLAYAYKPASGGPNIGIRSSTTAGKQWSSEVKVNDDTTTMSHFFPTVAVDPQTGLVGCAWFDCRNDQGANSTVLQQGTTQTITFSNLMFTNILAVFLPGYNFSATNSSGGTNVTIMVTGANLPGLFVTNDGVQNIYIYGGKDNVYASLTLLGPEGPSTNGAPGTNVTVTLEIQDSLPSSFTSGPTNEEPMLYSALSTSGGLNFLPNESIPTIAPMPDNLYFLPPAIGYGSLQSGSGGDLGFGNYIGATFAGGQFYAAWPDNSDVLGVNPNGATNDFDIESGLVTYPTADFSVSVTTTPNPILSDGVVVYTVAVTNNGPAGASAVLTDVLPANVVFETAIPALGGTYSVNNNIVTINLPFIAANSSAVSLIRVTASYSAYGTNQAVILGPIPDTVVTNNTNILVQLFAGQELSVTATASSSNLFGGQVVTNNITVVNGGPAGNGQVLLTNIFSSAWGLMAVPTPGWTQAGTAVSPGTYSVNGNTVVMNFGDLATNSPTNVQITAVALATSPTAVDTISVYSLDFDTNLANNAVTLSATMTGQTLGVGGTASSGAQQGSPVTFTITVTNFGPSSFGTVVITNVLPSGFGSFSLVSAPNAPTVTGQTAVFNLGSLASNQAAAVVFTAVPSSPGAFSDSFTASSFDYARAVSGTVSLTVGQSTPPIENFMIYPGADGAFVVWNTPVASTAEVMYGTTPALGSVTAGAGLSTRHVVLLSGLQRDTNYYVTASSVEQGGVVTTNGMFGTTNTLILNTQDASYFGTWIANNIDPGFYGSYFQIANGVATSPTASAIYTPDIEVSGLYNVSIWYPQNSAFATNTPVVITGATNSISVSLNQTVNGGGWRTLATDMYFVAGTTGNVTIYNAVGTTNTAVVANAMRWVYDPAQDLAANGALPSWWANFFFGGPVSASADADGDGYSNYSEYVFGTDPTDATSHLSFSMVPGAANALNIVFTPYEGGRAYQLQAAPALSGPWTTLTNIAIAGTNGAGVFTVTQSSGQAGFYRLSAAVTP